MGNAKFIQSSLYIFAIVSIIVNGLFKIELIGTEPAILLCGAYIIRAMIELKKG